MPPAAPRPTPIKGTPSAGHLKNQTENSREKLRVKRLIAIL